jgi:hypothetical protein
VSCRLSGLNLCTHQFRGIVAENDAASSGKAGIHEELEWANAAMQFQELDLDYVCIIEAGIVYGGHRGP